MKRAPLRDSDSKAPAPASQRASLAVELDAVTALMGENRQRHSDKKKSDGTDGAVKRKRPV